MPSSSSTTSQVGSRPTVDVAGRSGNTLPLLFPLITSRHGTSPGPGAVIGCTSRTRVSGGAFAISQRYYHARMLSSDPPPEHHLRRTNEERRLVREEESAFGRIAHAARKSGSRSKVSRE